MFKLPFVIMSRKLHDKFLKTVIDATEFSKELRKREFALLIKEEEIRRQARRSSIKGVIQ